MSGTPDVFATAATALKPHATLLFTLERLPEDSRNDSYRLEPTGRFCHRVSYVQETMATAGLVDGTTDAIIPRLECGEPVAGLLVTALARTNALAP